MLLIRLAWFCVSDHGFTRYSGVNGPKLDPSFALRIHPGCTREIGRECNRFLQQLGPECLSILDSRLLGKPPKRIFLQHHSVRECVCPAVPQPVQVPLG
jgi:hypothetical protein